MLPSQFSSFLGDIYYRVGERMVPLYKRYFYISEFIKKATHCSLSLSKPAMEEKLINLLINITLRRS